MGTAPNCLPNEWNSLNAHKLRKRMLRGKERGWDKWHLMVGIASSIWGHTY